MQVLGQWRTWSGTCASFLFRDEQARQPVRALSGGERNRLLLARILARPSNLMILDEPTNDLDLDTLDLLEETLADYAGTLLLVSHDRDFLDRLVTSTIVLEGDGSGRARRRLQRLAGAAPGPDGRNPSRRRSRGPPPPARLRRQAPARAGPAARPHRPGGGRDRRGRGQLADAGPLRPRPRRLRLRHRRSWSGMRRELAAMEERWLELGDATGGDGRGGDGEPDRQPAACCPPAIFARFNFVSLYFKLYIPELNTVAVASLPPAPGKTRGR